MANCVVLFDIGAKGKSHLLLRSGSKERKFLIATYCKVFVECCGSKNLYQSVVFG